MTNDPISVDDLAHRLGRDRREVQKSADRGRIPGRKISGEWQFHPTEITQWLEQEMRSFSVEELSVVEDSHRSTEVDVLLPLTSLLKPELIQVPLEARTKRSVIESLVEVAGRTWNVWDPSVVLSAVEAREEVLSTAYENGVAVPHPRNPLPEALGESLVAYGRTLSGIPFGGGHNCLTDVFFLVLCRDTRTHLQVLARLGRMLQQPGFVDELRQAETADETLAVVRTAELAA